MPDVLPEIEEVNNRFKDAYERRDLDGCMSIFHDDCLMLPAGGEAISGKAAIREVLSKFLDSPVKKLVVRKVVGCEQMGEDFVVYNSYVDGVDEDGKVMGRFKDMIIWRKVDGHWLSWRDMHNDRSKEDGD